MPQKTVYRFARIGLSTDFDGGGLGKVTEDVPNVLDCWPYTEDEYRGGGVSLSRIPGSNDEPDDASFCFLFRLDGCRNQKVTMRFHVVRERRTEEDVSVVYANPDFPVFSSDGNEWERTPNKRLLGGSGLADEKIICVEETFTKDTVWVSYQYPFTNDHLSRFVEGIKGSPYCRMETAGRSTEGRDIRQIGIVDPSIPAKDKKVAWFTGLQHSPELGAGWGLKAMAEFLLSKDPVAVEARRRYEFKIIPIVNVDAVAEGRGRIHGSGRNLNREWERPDPVCDIGSIRQTLDAWKAQGRAIDILVDLHGCSAKDGRWAASYVLAEEGNAGLQARRYEELNGAIKRHVPAFRYSPSRSVGLAAGAGARKYGALTMSMDGWVYRSASTPTLATFYEDGNQVCALRELEEIGPLFVKALVDFERP